MKSFFASALVVVLGLTAAAVLAAARPAAVAPRPVPVAPGDMPLRLIGQTGSTEVLHFRHEGHDCYVASARNSAGVSLQCVPAAER